MQHCGTRLVYGLLEPIYHSTVALQNGTPCTNYSTSNKGVREGRGDRLVRKWNLNSVAAGFDLIIVRFATS